ncbi:MAG: putative ABC exporter domain-containing protein [Acetivibrionales bacterium]
MKPLLFLLRKRIKNQITDLRKKPAALAGYVIAALFIILMIAVSFFTPSSLLRKGSSEAFGAVVTAGVLAFSYFSIKQGINKGSSFFRLSDVNLVFTSPISPKKVLVYGFIQQLILSFAVVLFVSIQIPNLKNNFPVTRIGILIIYIGVFFLFLTMQLAGMLIYSFTW